MNQRLRIAFIDYVLEPDKPGRSGLSDIVWDMASELINQGHEAHIVASYHTHKFPDPRVTVHNFPTPPIGYRNVVGQFWILKRAADIVRQLKPDVVHTPEYVSTAIFATLGVPVPLVLTVPGNIYHRIRAGHCYEWYYVQILKWAARTSARHCARVIAISQEMKRWWEWTGSAAEQTPLIPLGVNTRRFFPVSNARRQIGFNDDQLLLLYVGRFSQEKGLLDLISSLASIRASVNPKILRVMLIGKGALQSEIVKAVKSAQLEDIVEIRPWVAQDQLPIWYSAADALLLPSHSEGFSRTIPEAMCCGTPVIGTRITGTEDHIRDGETGFLFQPRNAQQLGEILREVIDQPNRVRQIRATCLNYVQAKLTWQCIVDRIVQEVYTPLLLPIAKSKKTDPMVHSDV